MKKIVILIPIYNDWDSLKKLFFEINNQIKTIKNIKFSCMIINDASTIMAPNMKKPNYFHNFKIMNMKRNKGHARCLAFGLRYIFKYEKFDYVILMDGDGEDRPEEIKGLTSEITQNPDSSVVAKRIKRSEGMLFKFLYEIHKLITYIFTGQKINFGNYSCLTKNDINKIHSEASLWSSFSGTVKKNIENFNEVNSTRGSRYTGPSKMSLFNLIIHSFSIIAVFKKNVFIRSVLILFVSSFLILFSSIFFIFFSILIILFNIIIFSVSTRENKQELENSESNLINISEIRH